MTETAIKEALFKRFETLNSFSNISFITENNANIAYPNKDFTPPADNRWFALDFLPDEPEQIALGCPQLTGWTGLLQIAIYTPLNRGEEEADTKYEWIAQLFAPGTEFGGVMINKVYSPDTEPEENVYRKVVRVEWNADIDQGE